MAFMQGQMSEHVAVLNQVAPIVLVATAKISANGTWFPLGSFENYMAVFNFALITDGKDFDASIQVGTDTNGTGATDVVSITTYTGASSRLDTQFVLACNEAQCVAALSTATHIGIRMISEASQVGTMSGILLGGNPKDGPAKDFDGADVVEVVQIPD